MSPSQDPSGASDASCAPADEAEAAYNGSDANTEHAILSQLFNEGAEDQAQNEGEPAAVKQRKRGPNWRGGELRALVIAMDAHGVFDINTSASDRQAAWDLVAADVNQWAEEAEDAVCSNRSGSACESQWRKTVYKKYKAGRKMSEIATGASEKTDEEWQPILVGLAEQWDDLTEQEAKRKEGKKKRKAAERRGAEAQGKACAELGEREGDGSDGEDEDLDDDGLGVPKGAAKSRAGVPKGSALLASTITQLVDDQERARRGDMDLCSTQHEERVAEAREAREAAREEHRERMEREDRRLDIEQERTRKETGMERRLDRIENSMGELMDVLKQSLNK